MVNPLWIIGKVFWIEWTRKPRFSYQPTAVAKTVWVVVICYHQESWIHKRMIGFAWHFRIFIELSTRFSRCKDQCRASLWFQFDTQYWEKVSVDRMGRPHGRNIEFSGVGIPIEPNVNHINISRASRKRAIRFPPKRSSLPFCAHTMTLVSLPTS